MRKRLCPLCGGNNTSKILWGEPAMTLNLGEDSESKKIVLGGCCVPTPTSAYYCNDCDRYILYPTHEEEEKVCYFQFEIGGFFSGYTRIEVEKTSEFIGAKYYPEFAKTDDIITLELSKAQFKKYIHKVFLASLLEWNEEYSDLDIMDGTQWRITVRYTDGQEQRWYGSNAYPPLWKKFLRAVNGLDLPNVR